MQKLFIPSLHILYVCDISPSILQSIMLKTLFHSSLNNSISCKHSTTVLHLSLFNSKHFPFQLMLLFCSSIFFCCCCPCFCPFAFGLISFLFSLFARLLRSLFFFCSSRIYNIEVCCSVLKTHVNLSIHRIKTSITVSSFRH
jgi:hypothetical protein